MGPTRELVMQIYEESRKFSIGTRVKSVVIYGGVSVAHQISKVGDGADVVIATVGRLLDFVRRGIVSEDVVGSSFKDRSLPFVYSLHLLRRSECFGFLILR